MKVYRLFFLALCLGKLFFANSQICQASFVYSLNPNGNITFSNTSVLNSTANATFVWDFGINGTYTTNALSQTISTTFTSTGGYNIALTATVGNTACGQTFTPLSYAIPGCNLSAADTATTTTFGSPTINFINNSTGTVSGTSYLWDFGDGNTSTIQNPTHTYTANGVYLYYLFASNNATCNSHHLVDYINVISGITDICAYTETITATYGANGLVTFSVGPIFPKYIVNDAWTFGNGTTSYYCNAFGLNVSNYYFNGVYTPSLQMIVGGLCTQYPSITVTVTNNPGTSSSTFSSNTLSPGVVQFSLTAPTTNTNVVYNWDFGDGNLSNNANPLHTYSSAGIYTVTCTDIINPISGCSFMGPTSQSINVNGIPCVANSNFSLVPDPYTSHSYFVAPSFPYNISAATWSWGDGTTTNQLFGPMKTYSSSGTYSICLSVTTSCGSSSVSCVNQYLAKGLDVYGDMITVKIKAPEKIMGIEQNSNQNFADFSIYPNPSDGIIDMDFPRYGKSSEVYIYDILGNLQFQCILQRDEDKSQINLSHLSNGIYFVRISTAFNFTTSKIVISK